MKRNNQTKEHQSSIFFITILTGTILGVVLLGLIAAFFVTDESASRYSFTIPQKDEPQIETLQSTYFIDHYVNYGGKTARIPNVFCKADYDFGAECPPSITSYLEINLEEINLPIQNITGAATDFNNYIAYTVSSDKAECAQKLFVYDLKNKTTKELNVPQEVFVCGAIGTHIKTLSPGGRFIQLEATGPASAFGSWIYDIEKDELVVSAKHSPYHVFLDTGNPEERDRYMVYQSGAEDFDIVEMGDEYNSAISIRDNFTGNSQELSGILTHKDYNNCYSESPYFRLADKNESLIVSSSQCLGVEDIVIKDLRKIFDDIAKVENIGQYEIPEVGIKLTLPMGYEISKNINEPNRRGSSISYYFNSKVDFATPRYNEIQFFTEKSIKDFSSYCDALDFPCFFGDYPDLARYKGQKDALGEQKDFEVYKLITIGGRDFLVHNSDYWDSSFTREYTTFINDIKVDIWVELSDESQASEADEWIKRLNITD